MVATARSHRVHNEPHRVERTGWLRAAVLGANDGVVSTASLLVGVAAADSSRSAVLTAGIAGLVAGAMSMAAGEYVSVSSQRDIEHADLAIERRSLEEQPIAELHELAAIYEARGVEPGLARLVAGQLMSHDDLGAHARDELGITEEQRARPMLAAVTSAVSFVAGAALPLLAAALAPSDARIATIAVVALLTLAALGAIGAQAGGASKRRGAGRVVVWGGAALIVSFAVGSLVGTAV